jgi:hypothetical protein
VNKTKIMLAYADLDKMIVDLNDDFNTKIEEIKDQQDYLRGLLEE